MKNLKLLLVHALDALILCVIFVAIKRINVALYYNDLKRKGAVIWYENNLAEDIGGALITIIVVTLLYLLLKRTPLKGRSNMFTGLILGAVSFTLFYGLATFSTWNDHSRLWLQVLPVFIIGFILPFLRTAMERAILI